MVASPATVTISFFVRGRPVTKGSMFVRHQHGGYDHVTKRCTCKQWAVPVQDDALEEWDGLIATAAARAMRDRLPFAGVVRVSCDFYFARPKSHTIKQREQRYVITKGRNDSDKLVRTVLDALTKAAVWGDDSQAMLGAVNKLYCREDERPGVVVQLEVIT